MATSSVERRTAPRVLCIAPRWLGDAILARPALAWLGARGVRLELSVRGAVGRVLEDLPGVQAVHAVPGTSRGRRLLDALHLRRRGFDAALVLPPSFSSALAARFATTQHRVGYRHDRRDFLLDRPLRDPGSSVHLAQQDLLLARAVWAALGGGDESPPEGTREMPLLAVQQHEIEAARRRLAAAGIAGAAYLVVAPGARYGAAKRYPAERFAAAAGALVQRHGWRVVLVGEAGDGAATAAVREALPEAVDLAGHTTLAELVGVLAKARGVLANDSGTMHLAAALGRPVVGVFGSTNPRWTAPLGPRAAVVVEPVWCAPCMAPTCRVDFACMLGIDPVRLVTALEERLES